MPCFVRLGGDASINCGGEDSDDPSTSVPPMSRDTSESVESAAVTPLFLPLLMLLKLTPDVTQADTSTQAPACRGGRDARRARVAACQGGRHCRTEPEVARVAQAAATAYLGGARRRGRLANQSVVRRGGRVGRAPCEQAPLCSRRLVHRPLVRVREGCVQPLAARARAHRAEVHRARPLEVVARCDRALGARRRALGGTRWAHRGRVAAHGRGRQAARRAAYNGYSL